jgi:hypothetical protein
MITALMIGYGVIAMIVCVLMGDFHPITRIFLGVFWLPLLVMAIVLFLFETVEDYEDGEV